MATYFPPARPGPGRMLIPKDNDSVDESGPRESLVANPVKLEAGL